MEKYPQIILSPYNIKTGSPFNQIANNVISPRIKDAIRAQVSYYWYTHHPHDFPAEAKSLTIAPFYALESLAKEGFVLARYSALYLPSLALNYHELYAQLPDDDKEIAVIAYDCNFSRFYGRSALAVDLSMGFPTFVFWEENLFQWNKHGHYALFEKTS